MLVPGGPCVRRLGELVPNSPLGPTRRGEDSAAKPWPASGGSLRRRGTRDIPQIAVCSLRLAPGDIVYTVCGCAAYDIIGI